MLSKLSVRNARRSAKDYAIYMITMIIFAALMFAFNTMLLSHDLLTAYQDMPIMAVMLGIATFFIVIIIAWLISYMVSFMLEKRSREFGTYMLIGMKKKHLTKLFFRENIIMGSLAFFLGLIFGLFLQQVLMTIFYSLIGTAYSLKLDFNPYACLMTAGFYFFCYLLALRKCGRKFRRMSIIQLMNVDKHNQQINEKGDKGKQWIFFISLAYITLFYILMFRGGYGFYNALIFILIFIVAIYLVYLGLSSFVVRYIRNKRDGIYKSGNLFLLRQFAAKIKTMPFTMGTLTILFALAMVGLSIAMMFSDYMDNQMDLDFPFDISMMHSDPLYDFTDEVKQIEAEVEILDKYHFSIYQNGTIEVNTFLYTNLRLFGDRFKLPDGNPDRETIAIIRQNYYEFDTYMKLSDYNYLRKMLGYDEIHLGENQYLIQLSERVYRETGDKIGEVEIIIDGFAYHFTGTQTIGFAQDGHNGADYLIIIPDAAATNMKPFYSRMVLSVNGNTVGLQDKLDPWFVIKEEGEEYNNFYRSGTKQFLIYGSEILIRDDVFFILKYMLSSILFPLFYIALVYLCVALTVLSVQQLSDSNKYKFRYAILSKLGLNGNEIDKIILKQLLWYYLCPIIVAILISSVIILFASEFFVRNTGVTTMVGAYFGISVALLFGVYGLYFVATYVLFRRNIGEHR